MTHAVGAEAAVSEDVISASQILSQYPAVASDADAVPLLSLLC